MKTNNLVIQWCINNLVVRGTDLRAFIQKARGLDRVYQNGLQPFDTPLLDFSFHSLLPVPDELLSDLAAGYDWERIHWGVCWGPADISIEERDEHMIHYLFDTRDGPPAALLDTVSHDFPSLVFNMTWGVPLRLFGGHGTWVDGVRLKFVQYNLDPKDVCAECQQIKDKGRCPVCHPIPW